MMKKKLNGLSSIARELEGEKDSWERSGKGRSTQN